MAEFFASIVIGVPVSIPILALLAGGFTSAMQLLALSIICTAGVGLAFWIPVWWILGAITLALFGLFPFSGTARKAAVPSEQMASDSAQAFQRGTELASYIIQSRAAGVETDWMRRRLLENGWKKEEIEVALRIN
jgi:hypothetical protein